MSARMAHNHGEGQRSGEDMSELVDSIGHCREEPDKYNSRANADFAERSLERDAEVTLGLHAFPLLPAAQSPLC